MAASRGHFGHDEPVATPGDRAEGARNAADYAWEFLRRNPDYRADFARAVSRDRARLDPRWGLSFAVDPATPAETAEVFWRPEVAPGIVVPLQADRAAAPGVAPELRSFGAVRRGDDGDHLRLGSGLQLLLRDDARAAGPLVVVLALDADYALRVRAARALQRVAAGLPPPRSRLTPAQRQRLDSSLRALDGSLAQDSYRAIAQALFGAAAVDREPWKTASVRDTTIRLVRVGRSLMRGGYLKLLKDGP